MGEKNFAFYAYDKQYFIIIILYCFDEQFFITVSSLRGYGMRWEKICIFVRVSDIKNKRFVFELILFRVTICNEVGWVGSMMEYERSKQKKMLDLWQGENKKEKSQEVQRRSSRTNLKNKIEKKIVICYEVEEMRLLILFLPLTLTSSFKKLFLFFKSS